MNKSRLLLCRPQGGLNDILCQIEKCCQYADRFGRTVIVDTNYYCTRSFKDEISKYFVSLQVGLVLDADQIRHYVDNVDVFPDFIAGKVSSYYARRDDATTNYVEEQSGRAITFEFDKDYSERLLVHHAAGGGTISLAALSRMRVHDAITDILWKRQRLVGPEYTALHIRNTDYQTEYERYIEELKSKVRGSVFVATDNRSTIAHCKSVFGPEHVFSFAKLPAEAGQPLHKTDDRTGAFESNSDAILDLLMLALSRELYLFRLLPNRNGVSYSGFSVLAANLQKSRPLLHQLLSIPDRYSSASAEGFVTFYNSRGTPEQRIKEGKNATKWTRFARRAARIASKALDIYLRKADRRNPANEHCGK